VAQSWGFSIAKHLEKKKACRGKPLKEGIKRFGDAVFPASS
jgi:hypothetical protein